jgi:hypothetical protein
MSEATGLAIFLASASASSGPAAEQSPDVIIAAEATNMQILVFMCSLHSS